MAISVVPHNAEWKTAFEIEARSITAALDQTEIALHHIGSTAIPGILAKPIIDMLGVVTNLDRFDNHSSRMETLGYEVMGPYGIEGRRYLQKIDQTGRRTHHLHVFAYGSAHIERHLAFRDYLKCHSDIAAAYSSLKSSLTSGQILSSESYIDGKDPFIKATEKDAINWYRQNQVTQERHN